MKKTYDDCYTKAFETNDGTFVAISRDAGNRYWNVFVRKPDEKKGKVIATRCTFEKAMSIAEQFD